MFDTQDHPGADPGAHPEDNPGVPPEPSSLSDDELEEELCTEAANLAVAECRLVLLIGELDRREIWAAGGLRSCAHWLNWRCGVSLATAREQVRVGRSLPDLPVATEAFASGELSYSKIRAITRVARCSTEAELVEMARYTTASQLERIVREYRRADPDEGAAALDRHAKSYLTSRTDRDGMVVISVRLAPEDGAVVLAAIEAARRAIADGASGDDDGVSAAPGGGENVSAETSLDPTEPVSDPEHWPRDRADALVTMCESVLAEGVGPAADAGPWVSMVVHVDEKVLEDPSAEGCSYADDVGAVSSHTARRLLCDAAVSRLRYRSDGSVEPEGRTRRVPRRMRRAVLARDRGCRWPGCTQRRFVDVHHVQFVSKKGRTVLSNLTSICRFHHRLVHEGGFTLTMAANGSVEVISPDGTEIDPVPNPRPPGGRVWRAEKDLRYCGERFDMDLAIDVLLQAAHTIGG